MILKPMLAFKIHTLEEATFPVLATPKIDGIRCFKKGGVALSRSHKPIPNLYTRRMVEQYCPDGFDGELVVSGDFSSVQSAFMTRDGEPNFTYKVFDYVTCSLLERYDQRMKRLTHFPVAGFVEKLLPHLLNNIEELRDYENVVLAEGYEGVMLRSPFSPYKCGRSTKAENYLIALKRFEDSEAVILGFEEQLYNANEATINALGHTERSSHQENLIPKGTLGAFLVQDIHSGVLFKIGTGEGLTAELKQTIWNNQSSYLKKIINYSYQKHGTKDKPRIPSFKGFRHLEDM